MPMDAQRRSTAAGIVIGLALAAMGAVLVAIAARYVRVPDSEIHVPRGVLGAMGAGIAFCGAALAATALGPRASASFAVPGMALAFLVPSAWIAFGPGPRECTSGFSFSFFSFSRQAGADATCRAAFGLATLLGAAIVIAGAGTLVKQWGPPAWGARIENAGGGVAAVLVGTVLLVALVVASPLLLARWALQRAYARVKGTDESSEA